MIEETSKITGCKKINIIIIPASIVTDSQYPFQHITSVNIRIDPSNKSLVISSLGQLPTTKIHGPPLDEVKELIKPYHQLPTIPPPREEKTEEHPPCKRCKSTNVSKSGLENYRGKKVQRFRCRDCDYKYHSETTPQKFSKKHPEYEKIIQESVDMYASSDKIPREIAEIIQEKYNTDITPDLIPRWATDRGVPRRRYGTCKIRCVYCNSENTIRRGYKYKRDGKLQKILCKDCNRLFITEHEKKEAVSCKWCGSLSTAKAGNRAAKEGKSQRYFCYNCNKQFSYRLKEIDEKQCPSCGSQRIIKNGKKYWKTGTTQKYRCKDCNRVFTRDHPESLKIYPKEIIDFALSLKGKESSRNIAKSIKKKFHVDVSYSSICIWINEAANTLKKDELVKTTKQAELPLKVDELPLKVEIPLPKVTVLSTPTVNVIQKTMARLEEKGVDLSRFEVLINNGKFSPCCGCKISDLECSPEYCNDLANSVLGTTGFKSVIKQEA